MNINTLDLNLLVVFDALMRELHVTRAGESIGLSQPATSNALSRLRRLTKDDLFVRSKGKLLPTPTALQLAQKIQPALNQINQALNPEIIFEPDTSQQVFSIGMSDYTAFLLLPELLKYIEVNAPNVVIQVRSGDRHKLLKLLDTGDVDVLCGVFVEDILWHSSQKLFTEEYALVCRQNHSTIKKQISLQDYVEAKHLLVSIAEDRIGRIDYWLKEHNLTRQIALSVPHFLVAPFILAQTDLVATLAKRVAKHFAQTQSLKIFPLPIPSNGFTVVMRWHKSNQNKKDQVWLRSLLLNISKKL